MPPTFDAIIIAAGTPVVAYFYPIEPFDAIVSTGSSSGGGSGGSTTLPAGGWQYPVWYIRLGSF